jgi:hypothetical protein
MYMNRAAGGPCVNSPVNLGGSADKSARIEKSKISSAARDVAATNSDFRVAGQTKLQRVAQ